MHVWKLRSTGFIGVQVFVVCCDSPDLELEYDVEEEGSGRDKVYIARVT